MEDEEEDEGRPIEEGVIEKLRGAGLDDKAMCDRHPDRRANHHTLEEHWCDECMEALSTVQSPMPNAPWDRQGECTKCGLCCLYDRETKVRTVDEEDYLSLLREGYEAVGRDGAAVVLARLNPCPHLNADMTCEMYGKDTRPLVCQKWPAFPEGFYQAVKAKCGFTFYTKAPADAEHQPEGYKPTTEELAARRKRNQEHTADPGAEGA